MKRRDKKGSHVGVMISFVIFVTFLVFLYTLVQPALRVPKDQKVELDNLEMAIISEASSNLTTMTISLVGSVSSNCITLTGFTGSMGITTNVVAKDKSDELENTSIPSSGSGDIQINRNSNTDNFFKLYYSKDLPENSVESLSCQALSESSGYTLGITKNEEFVFESKMLDMINNYQFYDTLRNTLKVPANLDFGFGLTYENGTYVGTDNGNITTSIFIKDTSIQYIDSEGNKRTGFVKTEIW